MRSIHVTQEVDLRRMSDIKSYLKKPVDFEAVVERQHLLFCAPTDRVLSVFTDFRRIINRFRLHGQWLLSIVLLLVVNEHRSKDVLFHYRLPVRSARQTSTLIVFTILIAYFCTFLFYNYFLRLKHYKIKVKYILVTFIWIFFRDKQYILYNNINCIKCIFKYFFGVLQKIYETHFRLGKKRYNVL